MDFSNSGSSAYHEIFSIYTRKLDGTLLYANNRAKLNEHWPLVVQNLQKEDEKKHRQERLAGHIPAFQTWTALSQIEAFQEKNLGVQELQRSGEHQVIGIVVVSPEKSKVNAGFRRWFIHLLLSQARLQVADLTPMIERYEILTIVDAVTKLFEDDLLNVTRDSQWISGGGQKIFKEQVRWFIKRMARIEFCLPAFPCKSSNPEKVRGVEPDKSEEMALKRLNEFISKIEAVYPPGARIWIVSDGHVFSDCIGVKDDIVDQYSKSLISINNAILAPNDNFHRIGFLSLHDLFFSETELRNLFRQDFVDDVDIIHPFEEMLETDAELCRKILVGGCQIDHTRLKEKINGQDASTLALYRGFSRFMLEDLARHEKTAGMTKKKTKKLSAEVAFEMIARNAAYSNLIELMFPYHVRLSIHAHNNKGPKFGIHLLSGECKAIEDLKDVAQQTSSDMLHIPTPWHNCPAKIKDSPNTLFITKAAVIHKALESGDWEGQWKPGTKETGGYFELERKASVNSKANPLDDSAPKQEDFSDIQNVAASEVQKAVPAPLEEFLSQEEVVLEVEEKAPKKREDEAARQVVKLKENPVTTSRTSRPPMIRKKSSLQDVSHMSALITIVDSVMGKPPKSSTWKHFAANTWHRFSSRSKRFVSCRLPRSPSELFDA